MIKGGSLMVPRSVKCKAKLTVLNKRSSASCTKESTVNDEKELNTDTDTVRQILTDIVNKACETSEEKSTVNKSKSSKQFNLTLYEAIKMQTDVPYVDVGAVSYDKKVPVYVRSKVPSQSAGGYGTRCYNDVSWEPEQASRRPRGSHGRSDRHRSTHDSFDYRGASRTSDRYRQDKRSLHHPRRWESTSIGRRYNQRPASHRGFEFTIMSYNVLSQDLLEDNYFLYHQSPTYALEWKHRSRLLLQEFQYHMPDVICLQEVSCSHYDDFFLPELSKLGYEGTYLKRTGVTYRDGCATFYNKMKFTCEQTVEVQYGKKNCGDVLRRDNVALIVKLKPKSLLVPSQRRLVVSNTHLLFNPRRGDIKLAQLMILLAEIDKCACIGETNVYHPIIMCGDFNSLPHSAIYRMMVMGYLEYVGLDVHTMSGQEEDIWGREKYGPVLTSDFFPKSLSIDDNCKYIKNEHNGSSSRNVGKGSKSSGKLSHDNVKLLATQGSGLFKHFLRCISVYEHRPPRSDYRSREITTYHGKAACTVDYIFYSVSSGLVSYHGGEVHTADIVEGHLNLLNRFSLLCDRDLDKMKGLPNKHYGSDHISLLAQFLLT